MFKVSKAAVLQPLPCKLSDNESWQARRLRRNFSMIHERSGFELIREGVQHFRSVIFPKKQELYESLAEKQRPFALFLTCGDSRIDPCVLTGTGPGQIFVERTPGNIVPIYD